MPPGNERNLQLTITKIIKIDDSIGLIKAVNYIINPLKTVALPGPTTPINTFTPNHTGKELLSSGDYARMMYVDEDGQSNILYVTTYLCQPDHIPDSFAANAACAAYMQSTPQTTPIAYEFVQSFADDEDLTDEMVHEIGQKLGERIFGEFPFIVASHVHPITDQHGVRGKQKHNHFIVSASKAPEFCLNSEAVKLNSDHDLLERVRVENDRLAIEHGLSIIRDPDLYSFHNWCTAQLSKKGLSWVKKTELVVKNARDYSTNFADFVEKMAEAGYSVSTGPHLIYTAPGGMRIRDDHLSKEYTRASLEMHWIVTAEFSSILRDLVHARPPIPLRTYMDRYGPLYVNIPVGTRKYGDIQYQRLSLQKPHHKKPVLESYFDELCWYTIVDANGTEVAQMSGHYILDYLEAIRRDELPVWATNAQPSPTAYRSNEDYWYVGPGFQKDKKSELYRVCRYNEDGTPRSPLEVALRLKAVKLLGDKVFRRSPVPPDPRVMLAQECELQPLMDAIIVLHNEGANNYIELMAYTNDAKDKLQQLNQQLDSFRYSASEEAELRRQKKGFEERIARLEKAIKYLRMSVDEIRAEYVPKMIEIPLTASNSETPFTPPSLDEIIRLAAAKNGNQGITHLKTPELER